MSRRCSVDGCERRHEALGYCSAHWQRFRRNGYPGPPEIKKYGGPTKTCRVECCDRVVASFGLCQTHKKRLDSGEPDALSRPIKPRGVGYTNKNGYRHVACPGDLKDMGHSDGMIPEHRLVMARRLGRSLFSDEQIHHVNGNRSDNRDDNLELWSISQPAGQRVEDKVKWAREILERYFPDPHKRG